MIIDDFARRDPRIAQLREAYAAGCKTRAEFASHLGISERGFADLREAIGRREGFASSS